MTIVYSTDWLSTDSEVLLASGCRFVEDHYVESKSGKYSSLKAVLAVASTFHFSSTNTALHCLIKRTNEWMNVWLTDWTHVFPPSDRDGMAVHHKLHWFIDGWR